MQCSRCHPTVVNTRTTVKMMEEATNLKSWRLGLGCTLVVLLYPHGTDSSISTLTRKGKDKKRSNAPFLTTISHKQRFRSTLILNFSPSYRSHQFFMRF